ncbi:MAG: Crp/Fnr family transcriptional regulator [Roseibium sp.]
MHIGNREYMFRTGDPVTRMFYVVDGTPVLLRTLESGQELVVQRGTSGELFAEASLFSERYHCDAVCESDVTCAVFDKQKFLKALDNPEVARSVLQIYSRSIRDLRTQIELRNIKRADDRVLAYLSLLPADKDGWRNPGLAWTDIARTLGLSHEAIYRALSALTRDNRLHREDNRYRLL